MYVLQLLFKIYVYVPHDHDARRDENEKRVTYSSDCGTDSMMMIVGPSSVSLHYQTPASSYLRTLSLISVRFLGGSNLISLLIAVVRPLRSDIIFVMLRQKFYDFLNTTNSHSFNIQ